eukprot:COSAG03_NODE_127_length_12134_cov_101.810469_9_plen_42_part_00
MLLGKLLIETSFSKVPNRVRRYVCITHFVLLHVYTRSMPWL